MKRKAQVLMTCIYNFTAGTALLLCGAIQVASGAGISTGQWPQFRGPNGCGVAPDDRPAPEEFGAGKNQVWGAEVLPGHSSPCVWGDRIFITVFDPAAKQMGTWCLNRADGKVLWQKPAPKMEIEKVHAFSSPASSTPATDGERVYLYFGSCGAVAYDFSGNEVWSRQLPTPPTKYGTTSSPIVANGLVLLQRDGNSTNSELLALDAKTGQTRWAASRPLNGESYSTPMVWRGEGVQEVITVGNKRLDAYSLEDGNHQWWTPGLTFQAVGVAVTGEGLLFAGASGAGSPTEPIDMPAWEGLLKRFDQNGDGKISKDEVPEDAAVVLRKEVPADTPGNTLSYQMLLFGFFDADKDGLFTQDEHKGLEEFITSNRNNVMAIRPGGTGDISKTHVKWKGDTGISEMPSPLFYRGRLYYVRDGGMLTSYNPSTGEVIVNRERLGVANQYVASPVASGGNIYAASATGKVVVFKAGDRLEVLAKNDLGERITATPAVLEGRLYVRTAKHLYAFGENPVLTQR